MTVTGAPSAPELLVLHGLRVSGMSGAAALASRSRQPPPLVDELLLDFAAAGWVTKAAFGDISGWTLTPAGKAENARLLADELAEQGVCPVVEEALETFIPLNARLLAACTDWQIRPTPWDRWARNDHDDWQWDARVLDRLVTLDRRFRAVCAALAAALLRFDGYADRFSYAFSRVERGEWSWVDSPGIDSCHTVWIQFHEDLLATLGLERGDDDRTDPD